MTAEYNFSIATTSTATELAEQLVPISHFKLLESSPDGMQARARVGSRLAFRMLGAGVYNKYTAPVDIESRLSAPTAA